MPHDVFISYSSHDKPIADAVCSKMENQHIRCWIAPRDVLPGTEYGEALVNAIALCQVFVLVFSSRANDSPWVRREVERAVSKGKVLITFRIQDVLPSKALEFALSNTHWLDALTPTLEARIAELVSSVQRFLGCEDSISAQGSVGVPPTQTKVVPLRLTVHLAVDDSQEEPCCFITAVNLSRDMPLELSHVGLSLWAKDIHIVNADRPLPKRLQAQESWATWIPLSELPMDFAITDLYTTAWARLSTGERVYSERDETIPEYGQVPGGYWSDETARRYFHERKKARDAPKSLTGLHTRMLTKREVQEMMDLREQFQSAPERPVDKGPTPQRLWRLSLLALAAILILAFAWHILRRA